MTEQIVRLLRESLNPKLDPIEISSRIDDAYRAFLDTGKQPIELPQTDAEQLLSLIAYGHVADRRSEGAEHSGADRAHSNPRLRRFEERFAHVAEMVGVEASWDQYLDTANRQYTQRRGDPGHPRTRTIRSGKYGAPRKE